MKKPIKLAKLITLVAVVAVVVLVVSLLAVYLPRVPNIALEEIKTMETDVVVTEQNGIFTLAKREGGKADGAISDRPFKILGFTDTHIDQETAKAETTLDMILKNVRDVQPDLVVFVGDTVTGKTNGKRVQLLGDVFEKLGIYWTFVLGNHEGDSPFNMTREAIVENWGSRAHCLVDMNKKTTADGTVVSGLGNTQLNILGADGAIVQSLFMLDGGSNVTKADAKTLNVKRDSYDYLKASQIKWYEESVAGLPDGTKSSMFVHIPLCEFKIAYDIATTNGAGLGTPAADGTLLELGVRLEKECSSEYNSGMFEAILRGGSTQLVVSGHDHVNDYRVLYKGVRLMYNRASGYGAYNVVSKGLSDKLTLGASIYTINADGSIAYSEVINE